MLDSSTSVGSDNFDAAKLFARAFISSLDVGPDKVRVGLIHFNRKVHFDFGFGKYSFAENAIDAMHNVTYHAGSTSLEEALVVADKQLFSEATGMRPRVYAPVKILIMFTDGLIPLEAQPIAEVLDTFVVRRTNVKLGVITENQPFHCQRRFYSPIIFLILNCSSNNNSSSNNNISISSKCSRSSSNNNKQQQQQQQQQ